MLPHFGLQVSVLLDANGANTTAAAAVRAVARHVPLGGAHCLVLGGTGPVGQRAARLLAGQGALVRLASRQLDRAKHAVADIASHVKHGQIMPVPTGTETELDTALANVQVVISAGAAGAVLLPEASRKKASELRVLVDLNAVPPAGIAGIQVQDNGVEHDGCHVYGAIGVGGTKMKIHKAAIARLFTANDAVLDAEQVYEIALAIG
jgi:NAD(P)-dependent dehydrogenase (short-subunit alcohol dehydrogenase family)